MIIFTIIALDLLKKVVDTSQLRVDGYVYGEDFVYDATPLMPQFSADYTTLVKTNDIFDKDKVS